MKDMLFVDGRRDEYWRRVREQLMQWKDLRVLDVCCGFGQFADMFQNYIGVDFSEEMLKLARERNPGKEFILADAKQKVEGNYDVIFEVNSIHSMGLSPEEFFKIHKAKYVVCLEADQFTIKQNYD